jgi:site-specific recombinase XerD
MGGWHFKIWFANTDPSFGPFGRYLDKFRDELSRRGYKHIVIDARIRIARHLNGWFYKKKLSAKDLSEETIKKFLKCYSKDHSNSFKKHSSPLRELLIWLREQNIVPKPTIRKGKFDHILKEYVRYLKQERGLSTTTVESYVRIIHCFLSKRFPKSKVLLKILTSADINKFIFEQTKVYSLGYVKKITTALRSFFIYLRFHGDIKVDLAASVPNVADRSQVELPKYLSTEDVNKLLCSCDQARAVGIRDYALLILMARLGLRTREILKITLDDINWETGILTVYGKGGYQEQLPIPKDVGQAIVAYLKKVRPKCDMRGLFVSTKAPIKELTRNSLCSMVRHACQRVGLSPPHQGPYLLRHSLATRMLREGVTMREIAEILRHRSLNTTRIYAKVDLKSLREIAKPWPEIKS